MCLSCKKGSQRGRGSGLSVMASRVTRHQAYLPLQPVRIVSAPLTAAGSSLSPPLYIAILPCSKQKLQLPTTPVPNFSVQCPVTMICVSQSSFAFSFSHQGHQHLKLPLPDPPAPSPVSFLRGFSATLLKCRESLRWSLQGELHTSVIMEDSLTCSY